MMYKSRKERELNERKTKVNEQFRCCPFEITRKSGYPGIDTLIPSYYFMEKDTVNYIAAQLTRNEKLIFLGLSELSPADFLPLRMWDNVLKAKSQQIREIVSERLVPKNYAASLGLNVDKFYRQYGPAHSIIVDHLQSELGIHRAVVQGNIFQAGV